MKEKAHVFLMMFPLVSLGVFVVNMTYNNMMSDAALAGLRVFLTLLFLVLWRWLQRRRLSNAGNVAFALMVVNLAFLLVSFLTAGFWGLNLQSPAGIALAKISDALIICLVLIGSFLLAGHSLKDMYLRKGKLGIGVVVGILSFVLLDYLALNHPGHPVDHEFIASNIVWILLFVFSNAFMEELLFRGIFLKTLNGMFSPFWSVLSTLLIFAVAHMQVSYTPDVLVFIGIVFVLGMIWGCLMHYTRSILASVFFHAGADLMIIVPVYASFYAIT